MERFFNTAGHVDCGDHYCLPPLERFDLEAVEMLFAQKKYFVIHAPRQTGKTTCMLALMDHLNRQGRYRCLYCNVEAAQAAREDVAQAMNDILRELSWKARIYLKDDFPEQNRARFLDSGGHGTALALLLSAWAEQSPKPLVVIFDEIDTLVGDALISFLRQIRSGYTNRPAQFPQSVLLCGVRDVRDYRIHSSRHKEIITGGSAFNIKAKSLRLGDFTRDEVESLLGQHTRETGQGFEEKAGNLIWRLTRGQPWLVNALAHEVCFEIKEGRNRTQNIDADMVDQAKENLVARRETHLDQLADKLREKRVQRVISPMLQGHDMDVRPDDIQYALDLGLIRKSSRGTVIANPVYMEVIPRELTVPEQVNLEARFDRVWYIRPDGSLDIHKLLSAFQDFFREHSGHWLERFQYREAGPQLLLQAFLQRIINSGGRIEREYGLGRMRTDLLVLWPLEKPEPGRPPWTRWQGPVQKIVMELKVLHKSLEKTISKGLKQTGGYMDSCGTDEGHLVIFDRTPERSWEEKIFNRKEAHAGKNIQIWGM